MKPTEKYWKRSGGESSIFCDFINIYNMHKIQNLLCGAWSRIQGYARGWHTTQKIIIFESDDWGCVRIASRKAYEHLRSLGYPMSLSHYSMDALETDDDLELLYDVLSSTTDCRGRPACFTANMILANPDFDRIKRDKFENYYYEPTHIFLSKTQERKSVEKLWLAGMGNKLFIPQLHAREHVRWWEWLAELRQGSIEALETFKYGMCGLPLATSKEKIGYYSPQYLESRVLINSGVNLEQMIREGVALFERQFRYKSLSTVAPNVSWTDDTEKIWRSCGIRFVQGGYIQYINGLEKRSQIYHYLGEKSRNNLLYITRNCDFEPSRSRHDVSWKRCLRSIERAFRCSKPAIISSHRVNYIGCIDHDNRTKGLSELKKLLMAVRERWPDVYFISSPELGYMIENNIDLVEGLPENEDTFYPSVRQ